MTVSPTYYKKTADHILYWRFKHKEDITSKNDLQNHILAEFVVPLKHFWRKLSNLLVEIITPPAQINSNCLYKNF
jgi:hypothetical protein